MILKIKGKQDVRWEPEVRFDLRYEGTAVSLFIKKGDNAEQAILHFTPNGKVKALGVYADIGYPTSLDKTLIIEKA